MCGMLSQFLSRRSSSIDNKRPPSLSISRANDSLGATHPYILQILKLAKTERCDILIATQDERSYASYQTSDTGHPQRVGTDDNGKIFAIASLSKPFIAVAACIMIHKLSQDDNPDNKYLRLRGAWERPFTEVFNVFSKESQMAPLNGHPTIRQLLVHFKGVPSMNQLLLAPDGTPLLSKEDFIKIIPQYTMDSELQITAEDWTVYSNANYILMALLIEAVSKMDLHEFMKEHVFRHLGMSRTCMTRECLQSYPTEARAQPHVVSSSGNRYPITSDKVSYQGGIVERSVLGVQSCVADLGVFFTAIMSAGRENQVHKYFDKSLLSFLRDGMGPLDDEENGFTSCGLFTSLDTTFPGSLSLNRMLSPNSDLTKFKLGKTSEDKEVYAFYLPGSSTGWASTVYFLRKENIFVIVLTNTSGPLDASDLVSQLCLQEILHLQPSRDGQPKYICRPENWRQIPEEERHRAFYVELAAKMLKENALVFKKLEEDDSISDAQEPKRPDVCGSYSNAKSRQSLEIREPGPSDLDRALRVTLGGGLGIQRKSSEMRFVWTGKTFRMCSLQKSGQAFRGLAIDRFGDWRNVDFIPDGADHVTRLTRHGVYMHDCFTRNS